MSVPTPISLINNLVAPNAIRFVVPVLTNILMIVKHAPVLEYSMMGSVSVHVQTNIFSMDRQILALKDAKKRVKLAWLINLKRAAHAQLKNFFIKDSAIMMHARQVLFYNFLNQFQMEKESRTNNNHR